MAQSGKPLVGILAMSAEGAAVKKCAELLESSGFACESHFTSASRVPNVGQKWLSGAEERGMVAVIAVMGTTVHLIDVARAYVSFPVIALATSHAAKNSLCAVPDNVPVALSPEEAVGYVVGLAF